MLISDFDLILNIPNPQISEISKTSLARGRMKKLIRLYKENSLSSNLYIAQGRNQFNNSLIGWISLEEEPFSLDLNIYMRPDYRGLKNGTKLINIAKNFQKENFPNKELLCSPWNLQGKIFFEKHKIKRRLTGHLN